MAWRQLDHVTRDVDAICWLQGSGHPAASNRFVISWSRAHHGTGWADQLIYLLAQPSWRDNTERTAFSYYTFSTTLQLGYELAKLLLR